MNTTASSNFAYLAHHDARLVALATQAEEHFAGGRRDEAPSRPDDEVPPRELYFNRRSVGTGWLVLLPAFHR